MPSEHIENLHTLPTPVGPKNRNEATGLLGACSPALDILTAPLTALTTWSCPTTRSLNASSICTNLSRSPFSKFCTGIPVAFATTRAMSFEVTLSWSIARGPSSSPSGRSASDGSCCSSSGMVEKRSWEARSYWPWRWATSSSCLASSRRCLTSLMRCSLARSAVP